MIIDSQNASLLIFSMQDEFMPSLVDAQKLIDSCLWLTDLCSTIGIPITLINHKKLGKPLKKFSTFSKNIESVEVKTFSCFKNKLVKDLLYKTNKTQFILAGAETHISIFQSSISLTIDQKESYIVSDAMTTRNTIDHVIALDRLKQIKNTFVVTKEMVFFEFLRESEYPKYIDLSMKFLDQRYLRY